MTFRFRGQSCHDGRQNQTGVFSVSDPDHDCGLSDQDWDCVGLEHPRPIPRFYTDRSSSSMNICERERENRKVTRVWMWDCFCLGPKELFLVTS